MGSTDAPERGSYTFYASRNDRSMAHRAYVDRDTGFTTRVEHGRTAGLTVDDDGRTMCAEPTCTPNDDDRRHPNRVDANGRPIRTGSLAPRTMSRRVVVNTSTGARSIVDDNANGGIVSARMVRLVSDGDDRLPGVVRPKRAPRNARSNGDETTRVERVTDDMIRATILSVTGRVYSGPIDRRMRSMALDVIAHRESVGRYMAG